MTDPIADMLTRIRNAQMVHKPSVTLPSSKLKSRLATILKAEDFIEEVSTETVAGKPTLKITLKYLPDGQGRIHGLKRISKPGRRVYSQAKLLHPVLNGLGITIISTPQGLMTNKAARKQKLGGEVICEIY